MYYIGISAYYHESSVFLTDNNGTNCFVKEESFSRIKGDKNFIVKDFYKSQGFKKKGDNTWIKKIKDFREDKLKKFIKVVRK